MSEWKLVITGDGEARDSEGFLLDAEGSRVQEVQQPQPISEETEESA
jgi:hypothetical protein